MRGGRSRARNILCHTTSGQTAVDAEVCKDRGVERCIKGHATFRRSASHSAAKMGTTSLEIIHPDWLKSVSDGAFLTESPVRSSNLSGTFANVGPPLVGPEGVAAH
jgi:hypothetical protein